MSDDVMDAEKILVVERLVEALRLAGARANPGTPEHRDYLVLKAVAADLRAMLPETAHTALRSLQHQVNAAQRQKARLGFVEVGLQQGLAAAAVAHWPAVRMALARASRIEETEAERDMYQMMAHDLAADAVVATITGKFPAIAERWKKVPRHVETDSAVILTGGRT